MADYLMDTNHLGQAITSTSQVRRRLEAARKAGERLGTCVPVLCEIEVGILQVRHPDEYRHYLKRALAVAGRHDARVAGAADAADSSHDGS